MIPYGKHYIDKEDIEAVTNVLRNGALTQGPTVEAFELAIADYVGARYAVAVSSGTAALHLAALVAGVGPGRTLITSPITFVASANAGLYVGGSVAFADIDPDTVNMSPSALKKALEDHPNTRAVMPVHFAGLPCDMPAIKSLADNAGAVVIEDAAHALGASYPDGRRVGSCEFSLMTIFSFHPVKVIAAGEGGMITTNDEVLYRRLIRLRSHGINKLDDPLLLKDQAYTDSLQNPWYYEMQELGFHYRITDIQCALGLSQLQKLELFLQKRRSIVKRYDEELVNIKHIRPAQLSGREGSGHHLYVVRIDYQSAKLSRAKFMQMLKASGIISQVHYTPVPMQPYYYNLGFEPRNYPNALQYYNEALSLPLYYELTDEQQTFVIQNISRCLNPK
jgi:perosamine synthetase